MDVMTYGEDLALLTRRNEDAEAYVQMMDKAGVLAIFYCEYLGTIPARRAHEIEMCNRTDKCQIPVNLKHRMTGMPWAYTTRGLIQDGERVIRPIVHRIR